MKRQSPRAAVRVTVKQLSATATLGLSIALAAFVMGVLVLGQMNAYARADAARSAASNPGAFPLAFSVPTTDTFDSSTSNGSPNTAATLGGGLISCAVQPLTGLTFWRDDIKTADQDWFKFTVAQFATYTVTVGWQDATSPPSGYPISLQIKRPNNVDVIYNRTATSHAATFYADTAGDWIVGLFTSAAFTDTGLYPYSLKICSSDNIITPTPTGTPTQTPTPSPTSAVAPAEADAYDKPAGNENNTPQRANDDRRFINVGQTLTALNFYNTFAGSPSLVRAQSSGATSADVDWFVFYGRAGANYKLTTAVQPGVDTELFVFNNQIGNAGLVSQTYAAANASTRGLLATNDDYVSLNRSSQVNFVAPYDGIYYAKVWNLDPSPRQGGQSYTLALEEILLQTATPGPTATAFPSGVDSCEYNGTFDSACLLTVGVDYAANFLPFQPNDANAQDNDYYRIQVKEGLYVTCETSNLQGGTDTNIIVYNKDRVGVGGNDDISPQEKEKGNFASRFSFYANYTGIFYVLAGEVNPARVNEAAARKYNIKCVYGLPPTPTPTITPTPAPTSTARTPSTSGNPPAVPVVPPTPVPAGATGVPAGPVAAVSGPSLTVVKLARAVAQLPVATVRPTAVPRIVEVNLRVFADANGNNEPDTGEGVSGVSVWLEDERLGVPLAQLNSDANGLVRFAGNVDGPVRVRVRMIDYNTTVNGTRADLQIALAAAPGLPAALP